MQEHRHVVKSLKAGQETQGGVRSPRQRAAKNRGGVDP
jgi:hypothetical protein